ncbi:MAG TPA: diacylglycerol kinase family lipid kinase [Anaerolineae bacterium]|nr:diacylglycerol kinase family lipid kinase [Anaerolineae bacterium]HQJ52374.1 diacylglycerol kinase family lipid kinase [Anaerolineae bacterium]
MARYKIIVNPTCGRGNGERSIPAIEEALRRRGVDFDLVRTERPWHAAELARQAAHDGFDVVVSGGGDGTANEVVNGLMLAKQDGKAAAMGILSIGRGNDYAFGMMVPMGIEAGCQALAEGKRRWVDVGQVVGGDYPQGRYFGNGVGIGFDTVVGFEALKLKWLTGFPSYIVAALKTVFLYFRAPLLRIEHDGGTVERACLMVSIMNGRRLGGGFMMAPEGRPDDGMADACVARQVSRARVFTLVPHFMKGTQATQPEVEMIHSRRFDIVALEGTLPVHADGETICTAGQRITVEILPRQVEFIFCGPEA